MQKPNEDLSPAVILVTDLKRKKKKKNRGTVKD